jgi:hypothetical protein
MYSMECFRPRMLSGVEDFCYLVEGYTDVISMHQADIDNVVASSWYGAYRGSDQTHPEIYGKCNGTFRWRCSGN